MYKKNIYFLDWIKDWFGIDPNIWLDNMRPENNGWTRDVSDSYFSDIDSFLKNINFDFIKTDDNLSDDDIRYILAEFGDKAFLWRNANIPNNKKHRIKYPRNAYLILANCSNEGIKIKYDDLFAQLDFLELSEYNRFRESEGLSSIQSTADLLYNIHNLWEKMLFNLDTDELRNISFSRYPIVDFKIFKNTVEKNSIKFSCNKGIL